MPLGFSPNMRLWKELIGEKYASIRDNINKIFIINCETRKRSQNIQSLHYS